jgi:hypothetical protein
MVHDSKLIRISTEKMKLNYRLIKMSIVIVIAL